MEGPTPSEFPNKLGARESFASQGTSSTRPSPSEDIAGSVFLISAAGEVLKLPIPSTSLRDPLGWTLATRITTFVCVCLFSTVATVTVSFPSVLQTGLHHEFPEDTVKPFGVKSLRAAMTFLAGVGYIIAIPVSTAVGRRPVVLATSALITFMNLWAGLAGSFDQLMAAICFQGLTIGATFAMGTLIVMDATFIHERPYAFAIFSASGGLLSHSVFMPLPFFVNTSVYWRPVYLAWVGPSLVVFLLAFFFIPETYFVRPAIALDGRILVQSSSEKVHIYDNWESIPCGPDCPHNHDEDPGPYGWAQRLKVQRARGTQWKSAWATYAQMLLCLYNPLLVWVSLLSATMLSGLILNGLMLEEYFVHRLAADELKMSSVYLGVSAIIASLLAVPASGSLIGWSVRYFTLRSGGIRHAEVYLPGFVLPVISGALSQGLFALGSLYDWHLAVFYVSFGLSIFGYTSGGVAVVLWIIEAFPPWASASLAVQCFVRDMVTFGIGINLMAWVKQDVNVQSSLVVMVLILVIGAFAVPIVFWGKTVRQYIHGRWSESTKGAIRPR